MSNAGKLRRKSRRQKNELAFEGRFIHLQSYCRRWKGDKSYEIIREPREKREELCDVSYWTVPRSTQCAPTSVMFIISPMLEIRSFKHLRSGYTWFLVLTCPSHSIQQVMQDHLVFLTKYSSWIELVTVIYFVFLYHECFSRPVTTYSRNFIFSDLVCSLRRPYMAFSCLKRHQISLSVMTEREILHVSLSGFLHLQSETIINKVRWEYLFLSMVASIFQV